MGLSCCKKISIENRVGDIQKVKIIIEFNEQFEVPIASIEIDGFLTAHCRIWPEMPEKRRKSRKSKKFSSIQYIDTAF